MSFLGAFPAVRFTFLGFYTIQPFSFGLERRAMNDATKLVIMLTASVSIARRYNRLRFIIHAKIQKGYRFHPGR